MQFLRRLFGEKSDNEVKGAEDERSAVADDELAASQTQPLVEDTRPMQTRPLEPPKPYKSKNKHIRYGIVSDVGQVRSNNQDACLAMLSSAEMAGDPPAIGLFIVADGMGGHHDGELASAVTVQTISQSIMMEVIMPFLEGKEPGSEQKTIPEVLSEAMDAANQQVQLQVPDGGTTATVVVMRGDFAFIAHVGDSRAYLFNEGNLELVTRDHSLVRRLQELGQLTPEEAEVHPQRNVLYRAIGQGESLEIDPAARRLPPSSRLLLCSDGLWGVIGDEAIAQILREHNDPQVACEKMVAAANAGGGQDNITAVLIQMPE